MSMLREDEITVSIVSLSAVGRRNRLESSRVVVDATEIDDVPLAILARLVRIRRVLTALGGDLMLAATPSTVDALRRSGLSMSLPHAHDVPTAVEQVVATARVAAAATGT